MEAHKLLTTCATLGDVDTKFFGAFVVFKFKIEISLWEHDFLKFMQFCNWYGNILFKSLIKVKCELPISK